MKKQYRFPYIGLLVLALVLLGLMVYGASAFLRTVVGGTRSAFLIYSGILSIVGLFFGALWMSSTKSYTIEEFSDTFNNTRICDHIIFLANQRKQELKALEKEK